MNVRSLCESHEIDIPILVAVDDNDPKYMRLRCLGVIMLDNFVAALKTASCVHQDYTNESR